VWEKVTVVMTTGWEYDNVTVENVVGESAIMLLNDEGARKKISFSDIRAILDQHGKDIIALVRSGSKESPGGAAAYDSAAIAQAPPPPPVTSLVPQRTPVPGQMPSEGLLGLQHKRREFSGPRFRVMFAGGAGYGFPTGRWFTGMTSGFAGGGALRVEMWEDFYFGFSYERQWLGVEESYKELCLPDDYGNYTCVRFDWDIHLDELYFVLGWMSPVVDYKSPFAYVEAGIGGVKHMISLGASAGDEHASAATDETRFGMLMAIGGVVPVSKEIGLNIEGDMRLTGKGSGYYSSDSYYSSGSIGMLFGLKIGLAVMLGGGQ
jgi:hypothetical protein